MARRALIAVLCALLLCAASFDTFAAAGQKGFPAKLQLEVSFISLDSLDDSNDSGFPNRTVEWSPRAKIVAKLMLGSIPRRIKLAPQPMALCQPTAHSRQALQDLFRFQQVYRI